MVACVVVAGFLTMVAVPGDHGLGARHRAPAAQVGAASGLLNLTNLFGTLFAPWIFGVLLDSYGNGPRTADTWRAICGWRCSRCWAPSAAVYLATRRRAPGGPYGRPDSSDRSVDGFVGQ